MQGDLTRKYQMEDLASGEWAIFAATGVTRGSLLDGVEDDGESLGLETLLMTSFDNAVRTIRTERPTG